MDTEARMPLLGHLEELRTRILRSLLWLALALVPAWIYRLELLDFVLGPLRLVMASRGITRMAALDAGDTFMVHLLLTLLVAGVLAAPLILREAFAFVAPALAPALRRRLLPGFFLMPLLGTVGFLFAHRVVLPFLLDFFIDFSQAGDTNLLLGIRGVFGTAVSTLLVFALVFQLPLLMMGLGAAGVVPPAVWFRGVRFMVPVSLIIGGILTPPDVFSQLLLAGPILVLYLLGAVMARAAKDRGLAPVAALSGLLLLPAVPLLLLPGPPAPVSARLPADLEFSARLPLGEEAAALARRLFHGEALEAGPGHLWIARREGQVLGVLEGQEGPAATCAGWGVPCLVLEGQVLLGSRELMVAFETRARQQRSPLMPFFLGELPPGARGVLPGGLGWVLTQDGQGALLAFPGVGDCAAAQRLLEGEPDGRTALLLALAEETEKLVGAQDGTAARRLAELRRGLEGPTRAQLPGALATALGGGGQCQVEGGNAGQRFPGERSLAGALGAVLP